MRPQNGGNFKLKMLTTAILLKNKAHRNTELVLS